MSSGAASRESFFAREATSTKSDASDSFSDRRTNQNVPFRTTSSPKAAQSAEQAEDPYTDGFQYLSQATRIWMQRWNEAPEKWRQFVLNDKKEFGLTEAEEDRIRRRNLNYVETPPLTASARVGTTMIIGAVGAFSKTLLRAFNTLHLYNMDMLYQAIERQEHTHGLLTFSNHQSVVDDPFLLAAILPARILLNSGLMRWGLCSIDICFQHALIGRTLKLGKALPIQRRGGIAQPFLRDAADKLCSGNWVHVYPEGRVRQTGVGYSKRGIGKLLAMAKEAGRGLPAILPMYHEGVEQVLPQDKETHQLESLIPHRRKALFAMTGDPVDVGHIFDRLMPACMEAGGTRQDPPPCLRLYEEVADIMSITMRLMRAELRKRARRDHGVDLGDPYEYS